MKPALVLAIACATAVASRSASAQPETIRWTSHLSSPRNDDGKHIAVAWERDKVLTAYQEILRMPI